MLIGFLPPLLHLIGPLLCCPLECDPIRSRREMEAAGIRFTAEGPRGVGALTSSSAGPEVQYGVIKLFIPWVSKPVFFSHRSSVRIVSWTAVSWLRFTRMTASYKVDGVHNLPKSRSHVKILDLRRVTYSKFRTAEPLHKSPKVYSLAAWPTWGPRFMQPWNRVPPSLWWIGRSRHIFFHVYFVHSLH